jgi:hypothetical protein
LRTLHHRPDGTGTQAWANYRSTEMPELSPTGDAKRNATNQANEARQAKRSGGSHTS